MVIHVRGSDESEMAAIIQRFADNRHARELRLGRRVIGWNLSDAVVIRSEGLSAATLQKYVCHFAPQRHVVFSRGVPEAECDRYFAVARDLRNYVFAFLDARAAEQRAEQMRLKERVRGASCDIVTLSPDRAIQQLEVLLMAAPLVLGSTEPLVLPQPERRRTSRLSPAKEQTAA